MTDTPTEAQVVAALSCVEPALMAVPEIVAACRDANAGFVCWDASLSTSQKLNHETWLEHKYTLIDALVLGFAFCGTDLRSEWLVLGQLPMMIVRTLRNFVPAEPRVRLPLVYVGTLDTFVRVYVPVQNQKELEVKSSRFFTGVGCRAATGMVQNVPVSMPDER